MGWIPAQHWKWLSQRSGSKRSASMNFDAFQLVLMFYTTQYICYPLLVNCNRQKARWVCWYWGEASNHSSSYIMTSSVELCCSHLSLQLICIPALLSLSLLQLLSSLFNPTTLPPASDCMSFVLILPSPVLRPRHHTITLRRDKRRRIIGLRFLLRIVYSLQV